LDPWSCRRAVDDWVTDEDNIVLDSWSLGYLDEGWHLAVPYHGHCTKELL
jgi:hypothetical protein